MPKTRKKATARKRTTQRRATKREGNWRGGGPSKYSAALMDRICARLGKGDPLTVICRDEGLSYRTVKRWADDKPEIGAVVAEARDIGYDAIADRVRATARGNGDSSGGVARDKLIVHTDLQLLAKWDPKRYGDKQQVEHSGGVEFTRKTDAELAEEIAALSGDGAD
jgi:hypothetical protein